MYRTPLCWRALWAALALLACLFIAGRSANPALAADARPEDAGPVAAPTAVAAGVPSLDAISARQAAFERITIEAAAGRAPGWQDAALDEPVLLYDLTGAVSAYLFPVRQADGSPAGYLTVAAAALPNPVLEFATAGSHPLTGSPAQVAAAGYRLLDASRPLYLGLLSYGYEIDPASAPAAPDGSAGSGRAFFDLASRASARAPAAAILPLWPAAALAAVAPSTPSTPSDSYRLLDTVPDWNQFQGSYNCASGCSPTASASVLGYWASSFAFFPNDGTYTSAIDELRSYMGGTCGTGGATWTNIGNIAPGIVAFAASRGYTFTSGMWCSYCTTQPTFPNYQAEISAGRPLVVDLINSAAYGSHTVAGVGYNTNGGSYMIVHDNWEVTPRSVSVQYGAGYDEIYMHPVVPAGKAAGWSGQYWNQPAPGALPAGSSVDDETYLFRDWGENGWASGQPSDGWSARFARWFDFPGGDYRFHCQHDDGCQISVDNQVVVNGWRNSSFAGDDGTVSLPAGPHLVKVDYFENVGRARVEAWWQGPGFLPPDQTCLPGDWCADYFGNEELAGTPALHLDEGVSLGHNWALGSPAAAFPADDFSARYTRTAGFACGAYTFQAHADDGLRVWVDGRLMLDHWQDQPGTWTFPLYLGLGGHQLKVEYYENGGTAGLNLSWQKTGPCQTDIKSAYLPSVLH